MLCDFGEDVCHALHAFACGFDVDLGCGLVVVVWGLSPAPLDSRLRGASPAISLRSLASPYAGAKGTCGVFGMTAVDSRLRGNDGWGRGASPAISLGSLASPYAGAKGTCWWFMRVVFGVQGVCWRFRRSRRRFRRIRRRPFRRRIRV